MPRTGSQTHPSLLNIIENSPIDLLPTFFLQEDQNFGAVASGASELFDAERKVSEEEFRVRLTEALATVDPEDSLPVETECQRVLLLSEGKGPTSLETVAEQRLSNEDWEELQTQSDELARSLWLHANHRSVFDDAVSFRNARVWRDGKLYSAFEVELDEPIDVDTDDLPEGQFLDRVRDRLGMSRKCGMSAINLPKADDYPSSLMLIVRHPSRRSSVAEHPEDGGRRLHYYDPQEEVTLIYTPTLRRIEVCGDRAEERGAVSNCFAEVVLQHDVSAKPLTWANYDISRFFESLDLNAPLVPGYLVERAAVTEVEIRVQRWHRRVRFTVPFEDDIGEFAEAFLEWKRVFRRALGIARVAIVARYRRDGDSEASLLEITISGRNRCNIVGNRSPELRAFGRKLLQEWQILQPFRDLSEVEERSVIAVLAELYELNEKEVGASFFDERQVDPKRLVQAGLLSRKGVEIRLVEEADEDADDLPSEALAIYAIDKSWLHQKLLLALRRIIDGDRAHALSTHLHSLGTCQFGEHAVPCYLARGLSDRRKFDDTDARLRLRSRGAPGIVFTGTDPGRQFIGCHLIYPVGGLVRGTGAPVELERTSVEQAFISQLGLILGGSRLSLVENKDGSAGTLFVPSKSSLALFSEHQVRCFRLLVDAHNKGLPGVLVSDLLGDSGSTGLNQMFGVKRWPIAKEFIEKPGLRWCALKTD